MDTGARSASAQTTWPNVNITNVDVSDPTMNAILLAILLVIFSIATTYFCMHYKIVS